MPPEECPVLVLERHHAVVVGLAVDVLSHVRYAGATDCERPVPGLPRDSRSAGNSACTHCEETDFMSRTKSATEIVRPRDEQVVRHAVHKGQDAPGLADDSAHI